MQDAAGRGAIKLVQVKGPDCDWQSMVNVWGASWESTSVPQPPLDFRIQDDAGVEVSYISDGPYSYHNLLWLRCMAAAFYGISLIFDD